MMSTKVFCWFSFHVCSWIFVFLALHAGYPHWVLAGDDPNSEPVHTLDPMVVTATKTPVPISHVTSAVEVITAEEMALRKVRTVTDVLRLSQGTIVSSNGGPGTQATVRIRGAASNQTLVLIDGAIVNSGTLGSFNFGPITTDNIESIEILRGAQSMMWGSDAMGGVVNIRTKRGEGPFRAGAFFEYGSFNTLREGLNVSGQKGLIDLSMALSRWDSSGFSGINYRRGATERDSFRNWQASSRLGIALPKEGRFDVNFRWWNSDTSIDSSFGPSDVSDASNDSNGLVLTGIWDQPITEWYSHVLTLARSKEKSPFDPGVSQRNLSTGLVSVPFGGPNETKVDSNRIETQHNLQLHESVALNLGYQFREQNGKNDTGLSKETLSSNSGYAQFQVNFFERLFATAGVRYDDYNTFGNSTTYRVTGGYLLKETDTKIRSSWATGFRAPTINELYFPNFGNSDLDPEKSKSFDVAVDQFLLSKRLKLSVGYFWNRYKDLIETIQDVGACGTGPFGTNFCPVNVSKARTEGWETSAALVLAQDLPYMKLLDILGQYTYTSTRNLDTDRRLARVPVDQVSIRVHYQPIDPLNVVLDFRWVGSQFNRPSTAQDDSQRVDSFKVVNLAVSYDVMKQVEVYTRIDNLFNEKYEEILFFGTPVRSVFGGIRVQFDLPFGDTSS
jgi:vitamin B12 transporter